MRTIQNRNQSHGNETRNLLSINVPLPFLVAGFVLGLLVAAAFLGILFLSSSSQYRPLAIWILPLSSGGLLFLMVLLSVFRGEILYGGPGIIRPKVLRRADRPVGFWFVLAAFSTLATALMLLGLTGLHSHLFGDGKTPSTTQNSPARNPIIQPNTKNNSETILKVLFSENGFVDQVQILRSCGQPGCDTEAIKGVKKASFQSLRREGIPSDGWLIVKVTHQP